MYSLAFLTYFGFYVSREPYSLVKMTLLKTWAPFNGHDGWLLLGILDTASLGEIFRKKIKFNNENQGQKPSFEL